MTLGFFPSNGSAKMTSGFLSILTLSAFCTAGCVSDPDSARKEKAGNPTAYSAYMPRIIHTDIDPYLSLEGKSDHEIRELLLRMFELDQAYRDSLITKRNPDRNSHYLTRMMATDASNRILLDKIVEGYGWPTISRFGREGAEAAWYIVWHDRGNREYMSRYHSLMREAYEHNEMDAQQYKLVKDLVELYASQ